MRIMIYTNKLNTIAEKVRDSAFIILYLYAKNTYDRIEKIQMNQILRNGKNKDNEILNGGERMQLSTQDHLKKAILDLQAHVREFMNYSAEAEDKKLSRYFKECAEEQAQQAATLQTFLD